MSLSDNVNTVGWIDRGVHPPPTPVLGSTGTERGFCFQPIPSRIDLLTTAEFVQKVLLAVRERRHIRTILFKCTTGPVPVLVDAMRVLLSHGYVVVLSTSLRTQREYVVAMERGHSKLPFFVTPDSSTGVEDLGAIADLTKGKVTDLLLLHDTPVSVSAAVYKGVWAEYVAWSLCGTGLQARHLPTTTVQRDIGDLRGYVSTTSSTTPVHRL